MLLMAEAGCLRYNISGVTPCTTPPTLWFAHKLPHLTSLVDTGGAVNTLVFIVG